MNLYQLQVLTYRVVPFNREEHAMDGYTTRTGFAAAPSRSEVAPSAGKARWAAAGGERAENAARRSPPRLAGRWRNLAPTRHCREARFRVHDVPSLLLGTGE